MTTVEKEQFWTQIVENPSLWGTIQTSDKSFNTQAENIWTVMNETFIKNGSLKEVNRWELMLGDRLENSGEGTLDERKARILKRITEHPPVTIVLLEQLIKELTEGDCDFDYNKRENELNIRVEPYFESSVIDLVSRLISKVETINYETDGLPKGFLQADFIELGRNDIFVTNFTPKGYTHFTQTFRGNVNNPAWNSSGYLADSNCLNENPKWVWRFYSTNLGWFFTKYPYMRNLPGIDFGNTVEQKMTIKVTDTSITYDGKTYNFGNLTNYTYSDVTTETLCVTAKGYNNHLGRLYNVAFYDGETKMFDITPCITKDGEIAIVDSVTNKLFPSREIFTGVIGLNTKQARKLGSLPISDSAIKCSLPIGYDSDEAIMNAINIATNNGWALTVQVHAPEPEENTSSTFGMQRIWVRKIEEENGNYIDNEGKRYQVEWCVAMYTPDNSTPDQHGYEMFRNVESAVEYWGLSQWIDPEIENMLEQQIQ